jgi:hypothetical protein
LSSAPVMTTWPAFELLELAGAPLLSGAPPAPLHAAKANVMMSTASICLVTWVSSSSRKVPDGWQYSPYPDSIQLHKLLALATSPGKAIVGRGLRIRLCSYFLINGRYSL